MCFEVVIIGILSICAYISSYLLWGHDSGLGYALLACAVFLSFMARGMWGCGSKHIAEAKRDYEQAMNELNEIYKDEQTKA